MSKYRIMLEARERKAAIENDMEGDLYFLKSGMRCIEATCGDDSQEGVAISLLVETLNDMASTIKARALEIEDARVKAKEDDALDEAKALVAELEAGRQQGGGQDLGT